MSNEPQIEYLDQNSDDIRFFLVEGDFNKKQFTIIKEDEFEWNDLTISYGILGESHFVSFKDKDKIFTEICACSPATFNQKKSLLHTSCFLTEVKDITMTEKWGNFMYSFQYNCMKYSRGLLALDDIESVKNENDVLYMNHFFPSKKYARLKPFTSVYIKKAKNGLFIRTIHTYPNDKLIVFTSSSLKLN